MWVYLKTSYSVIVVCSIFQNDEMTFFDMQLKCFVDFFFVCAYCSVWLCGTRVKCVISIFYWWWRIVPTNSGDEVCWINIWLLGVMLFTFQNFLLIDFEVILNILKFFNAASHLEIINLGEIKLKRWHIIKS